MDSWIDAFTGSSFDINAQVELKPNDLQTLQQNIFENVRLKVSSVAPLDVSPKTTSEVTWGSQGFVSLFSTDSEPHLKYCPCDIQNRCLKSPIATLSRLNRSIKICIRGPNDVDIHQSSLSMLGKHLLVSQPSFIIENDDVGNTNVAFVTGQLTDRFFEIDHRGISIIGTTSIVKGGTVTEAGFLVHYVINNPLEPILSSSGNQDEQSEKEDGLFRVDSPSLSTKFMFEIEIVDDRSILETLQETSSKILTTSSTMATTTNENMSSFTPTTSTSPTTTSTPTIVLPLGTEVCQCDEKLNDCLSGDMPISFASKDDIHICIT